MNETDELIYNRYITVHNEDDFRLLLERHRESLTLFLMGYVHNPEDAEELMLDAYAVAAAGKGFSGRSSFKTWLFAVGKKLAISHLRKKHFFFVSSDEQPEQEAITAEAPEMDLLTKERNLQIYDAINSLNNEYRQILILLYFEEMTHDEVSRVMKKNRKQIYNLAERSKKALKAELERRGFENAQY